MTLSQQEKLELHFDDTLRVQHSPQPLMIPLFLHLSPPYASSPRPCFPGLPPLPEAMGGSAG